MEHIDSSQEHPSGTDAFWNPSNSNVGFLIAGSIIGVTVITLVKCLISGGSAESPGRIRTLVSSVTLTVGMFAIAATSAFVEQYLRILQHFHSRSSETTGDRTDSKSSNRNGKWNISYMQILRNLCLFGQRLLTFRAACLIASSSKWNIPLTTLVASIILIPRIFFSLFVVRNLRDMSRPQPKDPKRDVNMSIKILHFANKGFQRIFGVLSNVETLIYFLCKQFEFTLMQLLGYDYHVKSILLFGDLESVAFVGWNVWTGSELCYDIKFIVGLSFVICLRFGFRIRRKMRAKSA